MKSSDGLRTLAFSIALASCFPARAEPGITSSEIRLGQSAAFSGAVAPQVKELTSGALAHFADVNRRGGVHGRKIVLESMDDAFDPKRAAENTRKLIDEKNVFGLFLYRATPTTEAALPIIEAAKVPLVGPSTGAQSMYSPTKRYLFPVRPSYHAEATKIIDQLAAMSLTRIAVLHADDSFGKDGLAGYQAAMTARGMKPVAVASYARGTVKVEDAVKAIASAQPQAVVMVCAANAGAAFIKQARKLGASPQFVLLSNVSSQAFIQDLGADGRGVAVSQVGPWPFSVDTPLVKEYQAAMKGNKSTEYSYSSLEGFIAAKVMVEGLRRAGPAPTREKLVAALESLARHDLGGVNLQYSPSDRTGTTYVELSIIGRNGRFMR
jgi:ABC-type branched-subunit amino acid transport system substrate-binding protein